MQQIYRKTPMPKSNLYNVAKQLYLNHTSTWVFFCKFDVYFRNTFTRYPITNFLKMITKLGKIYSKNQENLGQIFIKTFVYPICLVVLNLNVHCIHNNSTVALKRSIFNDESRGREYEVYVSNFGGYHFFGQILFQIKIIESSS